MPAPDHCYNCDIPAIGKTQHGVPMCKRCLAESEAAEPPKPANAAWSTATWYGAPLAHSAACKCSRCSG